MVKNLPTNAGGAGSFPIWEDPLEKEMATPLQYSCPGNPWTEEAGGLQPMRSQESDTI